MVAEESARMASLITENFDTPQLWKRDDRYTWLSPANIRFLDRFEEENGYDYGDIMCYASYFFTKDQIAQVLMTTQERLEQYCQSLWHKSWDQIYNVLNACAKRAGIDVITEYAKAGNATAMALLGHSIMKLDKEDAGNSMRITLVNDLNEKESGKPETIDADERKAAKK